MRKSQNWHSIRTRRKQHSVFDLVTHNEDAIASQTSEWTVGTQNRTKTRTATSNRDLDDYEDFIAEELDSLFITPEEEQAIRNILDLSRKGKINASNAFDLPVKVIAPQSLEHSNLRFWKFASQLLQTSMNIYDKRVENVFQTSNRMAQSLTRAHQSEQDSLSEEQLRLRSKRKNKELLQLSVQELQNCSALSSLRVDHHHIEEPGKINIKDSKGFYLKGALFNKMLEAFDSNSLSRLFLNILETGKTLEIALIDQSTDIQLQKPNVGEETIDLSSEGDEHTVGTLQQQLKKLDFICKNHTLFGRISKFHKGNFGAKQQLEIQRYHQLYDTFEENIDEQNHSHRYKTAQNQVKDESFFDASAGSVVFEPGLKGEHLYYSADAELDDEEAPYWSNQLGCSGGKVREDLLNREQCHTVMTPWELQFRGLRLLRKNHNRTNKSKSLASKAAHTSFEIEFTDEQVLSKQQIFKVLLIPDKQSTQIDKYSDRFLLAKMMNPAGQILEKRAIPSAIAYASKTFTQANSSLAQIQMKIQHPFRNLQEQASTDNNTEIHSHSNAVDETGQVDWQVTTQLNDLIGSNVSSECIRNLKTFGLRSIRQMKSAIQGEVEKRESVFLSQVQADTNVSPAGMLIIFLHLVNEADLSIVSLEDEADVRLSI